MYAHTMLHLIFLIPLYDRMICILMFLLALQIPFLWKCTYMRVENLFHESLGLPSFRHMDVYSFVIDIAPIYNIYVYIFIHLE